MGETSDDLKEGAQAFAGEKMEQAKESAEAFASDTMDKAKQTVQQTADDMEKAAADFGASEGDRGETPSIVPSTSETSRTKSDADRETLPGIR